VQIIKSQKDFFAGLMFLVVGVAFAIGASEYEIGTAAHMGSGYFPRMMGVLLALLGVAIAVTGLVRQGADGDKIGKWAWRQIFFVLMANFAFGILLVGVPALHIPQFGLIVAIYALTFIASFGGHSFNAKEVGILATVLAVGSYACFVLALNLQFPVWPSFIAG